MEVIFKSHLKYEKYPDVFEIIAKEIKIHKVFFYKIKKRN